MLNVRAVLYQYILSKDRFAWQPMMYTNPELLMLCFGHGEALKPSVGHIGTPPIRRDPQWNSIGQNLQWGQ